MTQIYIQGSNRKKAIRRIAICFCLMFLTCSPLIGGEQMSPRDESVLKIDQSLRVLKESWDGGDRSKTQVRQSVEEIERVFARSKLSFDSPAFQTGSVERKSILERDISPTRQTGTGSLDRATETGKTRMERTLETQLPTQHTDPETRKELFLRDVFRWKNIVKTVLQNQGKDSDLNKLMQRIPTFDGR